MTIAELEKKLRNRINRSRTQHELLSQPADWNRLCSALDIIGDSQQALDSYLEGPETANTGLCYLHVYGALQVLQVQQDAVEHICGALDVKANFSRRLARIREIRSSSIGHPAAQNENKTMKSNFIVQTSLSRHGFTLSTVYSDGRPYSQRYIDIRALVQEQRGLLRDVLAKVIEKLDAAEMKHRAEHRNEKLQDVFPETLSYSFSKVFGAVTESEYFSMGGAFLESIANVVVRLRELLQKRGEWGIHDSVAYHFDLLEYPLAELKAFFGDRGASKLNEKDAYIFCAFLREELNNLQEIAREIDEQYAENPAEE